MKRSLWMLILAMTLSVGHGAMAKEIEVTATVTQDKAIVVAIHPYLTRHEQKEFMFKGQGRKLLPVGLFVWNNTDHRIGVEDIDVQDEKGRNIFVANITPYMERPLGAIYGREITYDSDAVIRQVKAMYAIAARPQLSINEIFYAPDLDPGKAHYGIIYIDARDNTMHPIRLRDVSGMKVSIQILRRVPAALYKATLSIDGDGAADFAQVDFSKRTKDEDNPDYNFYIGPPDVRPNALQIYEAGKAISDCFLRVSGKSKPKKMRSYGKYVGVKIKFSKYGDNLSHEITHSSGSSRVDGRAEEIATKIEKCDMPNAGPANEQSAKEPYYSFTGIMGDSAEFKREERLRKVDEK